VSRPDVDADRLGVTGISGGGASTFWIAAADERVKVAVPVSGMSDLESYVSHKVINGHCDCMFLINTYGWEWTTIAALVAPRPLLFCNSDNDSIFPMDGNKRIIERLRKLYAMYGKPELVDDYVSHGGHDYRPDLRIAIFQWINKHLKNDPGPVKDADFKPIPGKELRVFAEDRDIPADAANGKIDETFVPTARIELPGKGDFASWKQRLLLQLRSQVFRSFPAPITEAHRIGPGGDTANYWLITEPGIENKVTSFAIVRREKNTPNVKTSVQADDSAIRTLVIVDRRPTPWGLEPVVWEIGSGAYLSPRGMGAQWTSKSPPNFVERAHALLGSTVDAGRVWDVISTFRFLQNRDGKKSRWRVAGRGSAGLIAAYAALLEPDIVEVQVLNPPSSHRQGPIFLNVLRVLDIPDALGLLAPRKLTLINARDQAFDRTAEIYKLAGAETKFERKEEK
jgi:hypothetical protein